MGGIRRLLCCGLMVTAFSMAAIDSCFAQANAGNQLPPPNTEVRGKNFAMEGFIVFVLMGGALFAVCRSSRRT